MNNINNAIKEAIESGQAQSFGKIGNVEAYHLLTYLNNKQAPQVNQQIFVNAGIHVSSLEDFFV